MTSTKLDDMPTAMAGSRPAAAAGPFMLTLCALTSPVTIRPPQLPQLKPFKFFLSRSQQPDGREQFFLHMGYFATLTEAERWIQVMRPVYPGATPNRVPPSLLQQPNSGVPTLSPAGETFTDTQVLSVLEKRRASPTEGAADSTGVTQISLLRPEDSGTRRVLKEAVVEGAPVSFAVQLLWSVQPIDLATVRSVSIFKAYTLYATQSRREGRSWYCLRLGFFGDAISAKQVAHFVRRDFASVAVVPITEHEREEATQNPIDPTALAAALPQDSDRVCDAERSRPVAPKASSTPAKDRASDSKGRSGSLEQTLEMLASSEIWNSEDSFSETGVRHLSVQVQKPTARRG